MADITMCTIEECVQKESCYRFKAEENPFRQTYFAEDPRKGDGTCDHYWKIQDDDDLETKNRLWED